MNVILACDKNYGIGLNNDLPSWNLKEDMLKFKNTTIGNGNNVVIMGKNTYLSLKKPLKDRINIVISKTLIEELDLKIREYNGFLIFSNIQEAYTCANLLISKTDNKGEIWIIGGAKLYESVLHSFPINKFFVTKINKAFDCDIFLQEKTINLINNIKWTTILNKKNKDYDYNFYEFISI
tara:strand:+ start:116 stop:655 length:540 start_codon:yes stop_codon:yes gene_type:complete